MNVLKFMVVSCAVLGMQAMANADTLWGVTNGTGDNGFWTGGEIFTVDTANGTTNTLATYMSGGSEVRAFGDIALSPSGDVYVTYFSDATGDFKTLAKVNTSTWMFDWTQTVSVQMNSLTFVGNTLFAHAGGGSVDGLYRFDTLDGAAAPTFVGNSGFVGSDGDLAYDRAAGKLYNVYTPNATGNLAELDISTGAATLVGTLNGTAKFGTTQGGQNYGWSGLEFDSDGKLWAGTYWDQTLYSRPDVLAGSDVVVEYDLSGSLGGNITGLSVIPEPASVFLLGLGAITLLRRR